jgi:hypothetical protein
MIRTVFGALALALSAPLLAQAPTTPPMMAINEPEPARLALAREVVDLGYPPKARAAMFDDIMDTMMVQVKNSMFTNADPVLNEPGVRAIMDRHLNNVMAETKVNIAEFSPKLFEAYAKAFARSYTLDELKELRIFFSTSTGSKLLIQQTKMLGDPDVAIANTEYMTKAYALMPKMQKELSADLLDYLTKNPPKQKK